MNPQANAFFEKIATNEALQDEIAKLPSHSPEELAHLAQTHGFSVTAAELQAVLSSNEVELSDEDLGDVSGGLGGSSSPRPKITDQYQPLIDRIKNTKGID